MGFVCSCNSGLNGFGQEVSSAQKTCSVDWEGVYRSLEGDVEQLLKISVSRDIMSFSYAIVTNNDSLCFSLAGRAILKIGDLEWDEDDEGVAYPVDEYVYDSACYMAIRIEMDTYRRARIVTDDGRVRKLVGESAATMMRVEYSEGDHK